MANKSVKHLKIGKDQSSILMVTAIATVITVFCLFAVKALYVKGRYQHKAINEKEAAVQQLKDNIQAARQLVTQYNVYAEANPNVLGGNSEGSGNLDGDNAKIALDSLPSKYDVPALASSIEKLMTGRNVVIRAIQVNDDPKSYPDTPKSQPKVALLKLQFEGSTVYAAAQQLMSDFEHSIRPFDVTKIEISGSDNNLRFLVNATTPFQPAKSLELDATKEVEQ